MPQFAHLMGASMPKMQYGNQLYFGTITTVFEEKGWGFIACDLTKKIFEKDVFVSRTALSGKTVNVGDLVSFRVEVGMRGRRQPSYASFPQGALALTKPQGAPSRGRSRCLTRKRAGASSRETVCRRSLAKTSSSTN